MRARIATLLGLVALGGCAGRSCRDGGEHRAGADAGARGSSGNEADRATGPEAGAPAAEVSCDERAPIRALERPLRWLHPRGHGETFYGVAFTAEGSLVAYATLGLRWSSDGGRGWQKRAAVPAGLAVFVAPSGEIYSADSTSLCVSRDGGHSWHGRHVRPSYPKAIWASGSVVVAVGSRGAMARSVNGGETWSDLPVIVRTDLGSVSGSLERLLVAGDNGTILVSTDAGASWSRTPVNAPADIARQQIVGAAPLPDGTAVAITGRGVVLAASGVRQPFEPSKSAPQMDETIHGLSVGSEGELVAPASRGAVYVRERSGAWQKLATGDPRSLYSCAARGDEIVAVGEDGAAARWKGRRLEWKSETPLSSSALRGLWGRERTLVAVGAKGVVLRSLDGGESWSRAESGHAGDLFAVAGDEAETLAVGAHGTILRGDRHGQGWVAEPSGIEQDLLGVWIVPGRQAFAVGADGMIVQRTAPGVWNPRPSGTTERLTGVWGSSLHNVIVIGWNVVLRSTDGGRSFTTVHSSKASWQGIAGDSRGIVVAGYLDPRATLLRSRDGASWDTLTLESNLGIDALALGPGGRIDTIGSRYVFSPDGNRFEVRHFDDHFEPKALWRPAADHIVMAGNGGAIVRVDD